MSQTPGKERGRWFYRTYQIDIAVGEQYRITAGNRTIYVVRNKRGLQINKGGYARRRSAAIHSSETKP